MLLKFCCENFKSFRDGFECNMIPEKRMSELGYSILNKTVNGKEENAISASVIYGPNAAGKTSVVNAMSCLKQIIRRGNIKDAVDDRSGDHVSSEMNIAPFAFRSTATPITFDISFIMDKIKYRYVLSIFIGGFM